MSVELRGERVTLRAFRPDEVYRAIEIRDRSPVTVVRLDREQVLTRLLRSGRFVDGRLDLAIEADGELVGEIDARQPQHALPAGVFELGIDLAEEARGRGLGTEAIALLTTHLFDDRGAARVFGSTAVWNVAMRRVFTKLGFEEEGVLRAFMPRPDGGRDDYVLYARIAPFS